MSWSEVKSFSSDVKHIEEEEEEESSDLFSKSAVKNSLLAAAQPPHQQQYSTSTSSSTTTKLSDELPPQGHSQQGNITRVLNKKGQKATFILIGVLFFFLLVELLMIHQGQFSLFDMNPTDSSSEKNNKKQQTSSSSTQKMLTVYHSQISIVISIGSFVIISLVLLLSQVRSYLVEYDMMSGFVTHMEYAWLWPIEKRKFYLSAVKKVICSKFVTVPSSSSSNNRRSSNNPSYYWIQIFVAEVYQGAATFTGTQPETFRVAYVPLHEATTEAKRWASMFNRVGGLVEVESESAQ